MAMCAVVLGCLLATFRMKQYLESKNWSLEIAVLCFCCFPERDGGFEEKQLEIKFNTIIFQIEKIYG